MTTKVILREMAGMFLILIGNALSIPGITESHCDTLAGPVVSDAKKAMEKDDVTPVLKWVRKGHEGEIQGTLKKTLQ